MAADALATLAAKLVVDGTGPKPGGGLVVATDGEAGLAAVVLAAVVLVAVVLVAVVLVAVVLVVVVLVVVVLVAEAEAEVFSVFPLAKFDQETAGAPDLSPFFDFDLVGSAG